jgi:hypothetical protein
MAVRRTKRTRVSGGRGERAQTIYGAGLATAVLGEGDRVACVSSGNFKLLKSEPRMVNVPSRPSTRAQNVPSLF